MVLCEGAGLAGSTEGKAIMEGINQISGIEGLAGTFDYTTKEGEGIRTCTSYIISDGKYLILDNPLFLFYLLE